MKKAKNSEMTEADLTCKCALEIALSMRKKKASADARVLFEHHVQPLR